MDWTRRRGILVTKTAAGCVEGGAAAAAATAAAAPR